jgi:hypothetical protein
MNDLRRALSAHVILPSMIAMAIGSQIGCGRATIADEPGIVTLTGAIDTPLRLTAVDIGALPHITVRAYDRGDEEHEFEGVELHHLLARAGVLFGSEVKGRGKANTSSYLLARGGGGERALYSLIELDTSFSSRRVLLADRRDGAPLPEGDGPFRIIVADEKRRSRWVRDVRTLEVRVAE